MSLTIPKESAGSTLLVDAVECIERELIKGKQTQDSFFQGEKNYGMISRLPGFIDIVDVFSSMGILLIKVSSKNNGVADTVGILHTHTMKFIPLPVLVSNNSGSPYSDLYFGPITMYVHIFDHLGEVVSVVMDSGKECHMVGIISNAGTIEWCNTYGLIENGEDFVRCLMSHLAQRDNSVNSKVKMIMH